MKGLVTSIPVSVAVPVAKATANRIPPTTTEGSIYETPVLKAL